MKHIARIIQLSRPLHYLVYILSFLIVITSLLQQLFPIVTKWIVDEIEKQITTGDGSLTTLSWLIGLSFGVNVINSMIEGVSNRIGDHFAGELRKFLTETFYDKILTLPQKYFDGEISGKIVNQLNRGIYVIQGFANTSTNFIVPSLLQSMMTIAILSYYSVPIALLMFFLFPLYIYLSYLSTKRWGLMEEKKNKLEDKNRGRLTEVISNIRVVKSFTNEMNEYRYISSLLKKINHIYAKQSLMFHSIDFLRNFSLVVVLLLISIIMFRNAFLGVITIGEMVLILQLIAQARWPLFGMSYILTQIQEAESGSKEYFQIMDLKSEELYHERSSVNCDKDTTIRFDDVSFAYEDGTNAIRTMSFEMNPNEKVALVGHSGAGKSTIVNLILKFYQPQSGEIYINDQSYSELSHQDVREHISLVFQENELFSSTIYNNVAYGVEKPNEKLVIEALKKANAWEFVKKLPKGLKSEVGERGVKLSGGQKQRIQIARAIMKDAPILILDEATSSLDSRSESLVQQGLENLMNNRLVIIIAHRFSTIQNVDRVFVINDGRIVDADNPKALSKKDGIYSELLKYQVEGNKKLLANYDLY